MTLNLKFDTDHAALNDLILIRQLQGINEKQTSAFMIDHAEDIRDLIARMSIDADGNQIPFLEAQKTAGNLSLGDLQKTLEAVGDKVRNLEAAAIPPANGSDSL